MNQQSSEDIKLSRFLSLVLRHNPGAAGIELDSHGWAEVDALIQGVRRTGRTISMHILERIVQENNKQRYSFNEGHTKIRANQGHSIDVVLELAEAEPPSTLYHGTAMRSLDSILSKGILKQQRQYVHLSSNIETAWQVGSRHGKPVVLVLDTGAMKRDGYPFWLSENKVWLCQAVPPQYIADTLYQVNT